MFQIKVNFSRLCQCEEEPAEGPELTPPPMLPKNCMALYMKLKGIAVETMKNAQENLLMLQMDQCMKETISETDDCEKSLQEDYVNCEEGVEESIKEFIHVMKIFHRPDRTFV